MSKHLQSLLWIIGSIALLKIGQDFLVPIVLGLFFGFFFLGVGKKIATKIGHKGWSTRIAIGSLVICVGLVLFGFIELGGYIHTHWGSFTDSLVNAYENFKNYLLESNIVKNGVIDPAIINDASRTIGNSLSFKNFDGVIGSTVGGMLNVILVLVYAVLAIVFQDKLSIMADILLPKTDNTGLDGIITSIYQYIKGLLILVGILIIIYGIGLLIVGTPYAPVIAVVSASMTLVPTVGTIIGAFLAIVATGLLTGSIWKTIFILVWYFSIQQIEEYFILPNVVGKKVQLNVLTTISAIVFWGLLRGVAGIFLAIPIMGVIKSVLSHTGNPWNKVMSV